MKYTDILGENLKCEFINDLFETYDVNVIYSYDRSYENMEDEYRASIPEMGLEFTFNASQRLTALFMKNIEINGYNPFEGEDPRAVPFASGTDAMQYAKGKSIIAEHQQKKIDPMFGEIPEWVKFKFGKYTIHYQFGKSGVELVTLQPQNA